EKLFAPCTVNVGNFCASNLLCGSFSAARQVPPVKCLPLVPPLAVLPAPGVEPPFLLLPQPTTAIAPTEAPPITAACRARLRLTRCAVMRSQYVPDAAMARPPLTLHPPRSK